MSATIRRMKTAKPEISRWAVIPPEHAPAELKEPKKTPDVNLELIPQLSERSSQCFLCSRIYYGQTLERCPRCGSSSVAVYTIEELSSLARASATEHPGIPLPSGSALSLHAA